MYTRLLGRLASIFYFNREHFLFLYILKQKPKKYADYIKNRGFTKFNGNRILFEANFFNFIIHKPSLGLCEVSVQPF